jgi:hypothetical protein
MKTIFLLLIFLSIKSLAQECPCVKAAILGNDAKVSSTHTNSVIAMQDTTISSGDTVKLYTRFSAGRFIWYKKGEVVFNTAITPTETTEYTVKSILNDCPDAFDKVIITVEPHLNENRISIFPNPATSYVTISDSKKAISKIRINNLAGICFGTYTYKAYENQQRVNLSTLNPGAYLVTIELEGNKTITKEIIKH